LSPGADLRGGRVVAGHGRHWIVEAADGSRVRCHARGRRNEAVVGDMVAWRHTGDEGVIERIEPRSTLLFRQDAWRSKSFAANIDRIMLIVAGEPMFSERLLGRALIAAADAGIGVTVVLNKADLPAAALARERLSRLLPQGVPVLDLSMKQQPDRARALLAPALAGTVTLLLGPSGMGKSTLINLMVPDAMAQVGEISQALQSGRHTTTATAWYWLDGARDAALIDSPGFQEFGLHHVDPARLDSLMPDLAAHTGSCRFYNCTHRHEPGCAVRAAVEQGAISTDRWRLYTEVRGELEQPAPR
jgi:ribosome biogenesis GTPase